MPSVMSTSLSDALKRMAQILAVFCIAVILGMVVHKGHADISALAQQHSGGKFWVALAKYFVGNLAGGGSSSGEK
jgi:hypothetical protein